MTGAAIRSRSLSDWVGFLFFAGLTVLTFSKMPAVGLLLLPSLAADYFVAISFLIREPLRASVRSPRARLSAYSGSFLLLVFIPVAQRFYPGLFEPTQSDMFRAIGAGLWIAGSIWAVYSIWHLRRSFSIEPEARRLITSGPYGVARHPVYAGYFLQYAGTWLVFPTIPFGLMLLAWSFIMVDRMRLEEQVLSSAFPEYADYRRRVGALGTVHLRLRRPERFFVPQ